MEKTPTDLLAIALELIVFILIIGFVSRFLLIGNTLITSYQQEIDSAAIMEEYAIYTKFDNTALSGSDIVEAIYVHASSDFTVTVNGRSFNDALTTLETLNTIINMTADYNSLLNLHQNGHVIGITFNGG